MKRPRASAPPVEEKAPDAFPDAELLELGRRFDMAHGEWLAALPAQAEAHRRIEAFSAELERKPGWTTTKIHEAAWSLPGVMEAEDAELEATGRMDSITDIIRALPAHTAAGLAVKARAIIPSVFLRGQYESDVGLGDDEDWVEKNVRDLVSACLARAGVDWRGEPVEAKLSMPAMFGGVIGNFDLSKCDLAQLGRLYETVTSIWRHVGAEIQRPCFWDAKRENFNPAGQILDAEGDRLADLLSAIGREAKLRTPANDDARDERLNVLALHELLCNGRFHDRALLADINAAWGA